MHPSLAQTGHRPWPLPAAAWKWRQSWRRLAFLHYRADARQIQARLPDGLTVQEYDGSAWVAIVPFLMADVMRGTLPSVPPLRRFPELNVRTYVERDGRPGVWFFSLDADCWPIVLGGRFLYGLAYHKARMSHTERQGTVEFKSERRGGGALFSAGYHGFGPEYLAEAGTFEQWAAERYCLYSVSRGKIIRLEVHHPPWPLRRAEVLIRNSTLLEAAGLTVFPEEPVCHYSSGVDVVSYSPVPAV